MNNLSQNYKIILNQLSKVCSNFSFVPQVRKPMLSDLELVALNFTAEYMSINSELQLFRVIKGTFLDGKTERSVYNKRKRNLFPYIDQIRTLLIQPMLQSDTYIIDSMPVPICKNSRANRSKICSTEQIRPVYGYVSSTKQHYFGFKLHAVCSQNGIIHSFDLTPKRT